MVVRSWLGGMKTGRPSCWVRSGASASILVRSPWTSMMFSGSMLRRRVMMPLASAWAEKETLTTFILTSQSFLSMVTSLAPRRRRLPSVPSTQQPGMMRVLRSSAHHSLKTCMLEPPWSMPGVARRTQGRSALRRDLSKGRTFLNSKTLSPPANSSWIFSFCQSTNSRQNRFARSMSPAEKQTGTVLSVRFQQLSSSTDSSCARPSANTGSSTFPPRSTVSAITCSIVRSRSRLVSRMVVAQVVSVMSRLGLSRGAEAAPRCRSAQELQSPVQTTDSPAYSTWNMHAPSTCPAQQEVTRMPFTSTVSNRPMLRTRSAEARTSAAVNTQNCSSFFSEMTLRQSSSMRGRSALVGVEARMGPAQAWCSVRQGSAPQWSRWKCVRRTRWTAVLMVAGAAQSWAKSGYLRLSEQSMWMPASNMTVRSPSRTHTHDRPTSCPAPRHSTSSLPLFPSIYYNNPPRPSLIPSRFHRPGSHSRDSGLISVGGWNNCSTITSEMITYVHPEAEGNFRSFKYSGGNDSITYEHIWSPLADRLIRFVPTSLAPNLITFSSLLLLSSAHVLFVSGDNSQGVAPWRLLLMAGSLFVYQNLDNLDGKQARRTNSSSPLGMLFDHGTDAVASFLISLQVVELLELEGGAVRVGVVFVFVMLVYFSAMWAQYSTGFFRLGRVNPVDEGLPGYALAAIANIFLPAGFWRRETTAGSYNVCLIYALSVLLVLIIYFMVRDNFKNAVRPHGDIRRALLLPASYAGALLLLWVVRPEVYAQAWLPVCYVLMFTWSRNMIEIQVYFVTRQTFNPFNYGTLTFLAATLLFLVGGFSPAAFWWWAVPVAAAVFLEFVVSVLLQGSRILGIYVFSLERRKQQ